MKRTQIRACTEGAIQESVGLGPTADALLLSVSLLLFSFCDWGQGVGDLLDGEANGYLVGQIFYDCFMVGSSEPLNLLSNS